VLLQNETLRNWGAKGLLILRGAGRGAYYQVPKKRLIKWLKMVHPEVRRKMAHKWIKWLILLKRPTYGHQNIMGHKGVVIGAIEPDIWDRVSNLEYGESRGREVAD